MSDNDKYRFLYEIVENSVGDIIPTESSYKEGLKNLNGYEFIANCCLEEIAKQHKLYKSEWWSEKKIGEKAHTYLVDLKEYINDILGE